MIFFSLAQRVRARRRDDTQNRLYLQDGYQCMNHVFIETLVFEPRRIAACSGVIIHYSVIV
jgi:hypothetical protein